MEKPAKLFARNRQTLKSEVMSAEPAVPSTEPVVPSAEPVVPSAEPAVPSAEPAVPSAMPQPKSLDMFPELVTVSDTLEKSNLKGTSFLRRTSMLFEAGRQKQNRLLFFMCSVFLGLVVFTQICAPLFSMSDQLQSTAMNPAQLAGEWMLNDVSEIPTSAHVLRIADVRQHGCELSGTGSDEYGDYELVGKLSPPNKIHLVKIHHNDQLHDTQVLDGELALDNLPLYAHGSWTRAHAIDATKESLLAEGYWDANFYSKKPQPKFNREGILRSPEALMTYLRSGHIPEPEQKRPAVVEDISTSD